MKTLVAATVLALALASAASAAHDGFSGNVCSLLTTKEVASLNVSSTPCTSHKLANTSFGTGYSGGWGNLKPSSGEASLTFTVGKPATAAYLAYARSTTKWGAPVKVGDWARGELVNGGTGALVAFTSHGYYVVMHAHLPKTPLKSLAPAIAVAKAAAANL